MESEVLTGIRETVASLAKSPADYADMYMQSGVSHSILFEEGRMDTLSSSQSDGLGVRVIRGEDTAYAHTMGTTASSARRAIGEVMELSGAGRATPDAGCDEPLLEIETFIPALDAGFFHDLDRALRAECRYLRQATFHYRTSAKSVMIIRGDGSVVRDSREYTSFSVQVVLDRDGELRTGYETRSMLSPVEGFWSGLPGDEACSAEDVAMRALRRGILMLDAVPCPAGTMTVLLAGTAGGTMIHEACGHGLEADIIQKDFSVYRDRVGEVVASPLVTMVDDATMRGRYGSYRYDDEGTPAQRTVLIEDGVLKGYMSDILSARIGGIPRTGNGRRESYMHAPLPRMSNTFITPGTSDCDEMLGRVDNGILVKKMGGGEVNPTSGDFVFYVSEGYLVKNGVAGPAVKGATLTGNGPESLMNIAAVGRELVLDPGTCGKSGQGVPVTDGQPTLLINNLTVGGSDTGDAV
ncbi:MAG: TldD/PmbA family protein [Synergistaceae bacterium]|jgi:TldD protein|nr:TldD/PmbA family protein [Synergistaceae bacterium]